MLHHPTASTKLLRSSPMIKTLLQKQRQGIPAPSACYIQVTDTGTTGEVEDEKTLESSVTRSTGALASWEFGSHVSPVSQLRSRQVPRPQAQGLRTAVAGTQHCSSCLLCARSRDPFPFQHPGRAGACPPRDVRSTGLTSCTCRGPLGTGLSSGSLVSARKAPRSQR